MLGAFLPAPALAQIDWIRPPMCSLPGGSGMVPCQRRPKPKPVKPLRCKYKGIGGWVYIPCVPKPKPKGNGAIDGNGIQNRVNNGLYTNKVWNNLK